MSAEQLRALLSDTALEYGIIDDRTDLELAASQDSRHRLTIGLEILYRPSGSNNIHLRVSPSLIKNSKSFDYKRVRHCFQIWLPACLQLSAIIGHSLRWHFSVADVGDSQALCMDGEDRNLLIPDLYSYAAAKKCDISKALNTFDSFRAEWHHRKPIMFWRGSTTGTINKPIRDIATLEGNHRVQACARFRDQRGFNLAISRIVDVDPEIFPKAKEFLSAKRLISSVVDEKDFANYRYYPDLPGNALAWGTIYKYLYGILVFRPNTTRQLCYHRFMQPWKHYIPVRSDLGDLPDAMKWADNNPEDASFIAYRGRSVVVQFLNHLDEALLTQLLNEAIIIT